MNITKNITKIIARYPTSLSQLRTDTIIISYYTLKKAEFNTEHHKNLSNSNNRSNTNNTALIKTKDNIYDNHSFVGLVCILIGECQQESIVDKL